MQCISPASEVMESFILTFHCKIVTPSKFQCFLFILSDLRTVSIPHNLCLVNDQFGPSPSMHIVVSDLLEHHRAIFSRPVPVYNSVVCLHVSIFVKVDLFPHAVGVLQMPELLQDLLAEPHICTFQISK